VSIVQDLLKSGRSDELWQLCCGFLDWGLEQFMKVQNSLLLEQIEVLNACALGKKIMREAKPETIEEFRRNVPLTTYVDYCPELLERREDVLPSRPVRWIQTSGKGGQYPFKWVPISPGQWEESGLNFSAIAILGSCHRKGEVVLKPGMKLLHAAAQSPFLTSAVAYRLAMDVDFKFLPGLEEADQLSFEERVKIGYNRALSEGMDGFFGLARVLVAIGKKFETGSRGTGKRGLPLNPPALLRFSKGLIESRKHGRSMLPRDLWNLKVITSMGTDALIFKDRIKELWGRMPLTVYGNTETIVAATQTWDYNDMVFFPNLNFLEFIPEEEINREDSNIYYHPETVLLSEVESGKCYELVVTNLHGGALVRYRTGDLIRVTSLCNKALKINLPQISLEGRVDDLIDLGLIRLNEKVIWQALENTHIPYKDWTAHKEIGGNPKLHLYLELAEGYYISSEEVASRLYRAIKNLDDGLYVYRDIADIEKLVDYHPIEVTLLPDGTFSGYKKIRQSEGAELADLKPPHINPSKEDLAILSAGVQPLPQERTRLTVF
jgi:hypothetical protein